MTQTELAAAGFELSDAEHVRLTRFVELLRAENERVNLTGTRDPRDLWSLHVCDSLALLPLIDEHRPARLLDLGTGGGLPGLVVACVCPGIHVTLLDATQKKLVALGRITAELGLTNAATLWGRAETLAHQPAHREQYDAVTVRAVGDLRVCLEYATGFLRPGGHGWFYRSRRSAEEDAAPAERAANRCRLTQLDTRLYLLPEPHGERALMVYHKDRGLPASLPRAVGRPRSEPL